MNEWTATILVGHSDNLELYKRIKNAMKSDAKDQQLYDAFVTRKLDDGTGYIVTLSDESMKRMSEKELLSTGTGAMLLQDFEGTQSLFAFLRPKVLYNGLQEE
jgi:hypothetical protein